MIPINLLLSLLRNLRNCAEHYVPQFLCLFIAIFLILRNCGTISHIASCVRDFYIHIHTRHITHIFPYSVYIGFLFRSSAIPILRALRCVQPFLNCSAVPHTYNNLTNPLSYSSSKSVTINTMHSVCTPLSRLHLVIALPLVCINPFDFNQDVIAL